MLTYMLKKFSVRVKMLMYRWYLLGIGKCKEVIEKTSTCCTVLDNMILCVTLQDYFGVLNDFNGRLSVASEDKPLVIFLDGLDQLGPQHSPQKVQTWFPKQLPEHVHMILSTSSSTEIEILKSLKVRV